MTTIEQIQKINREHQCAKIGKVLVDGFTASAVCQLYERMSEENRAKFAALPLIKMVDITWKIIKAHS